MKIKWILLTLFVLFIVAVNNQATSQINIQRSYENYVTYLVDGFNVQNSWAVKFSRFRTHNWDTNSNDYQDSQAFLRWKKAEGPAARYILPPYPEEQRDTAGAARDTAPYILGVRGKFIVHGYNWLVLEPRKPLFLKGIGRAISFWIWGGNYRYRISITVKDYLGGFHEIDGGSLAYVGWKYVRINIPSTIPQRDVRMPANKFLQFLRIKFESDFDELPDKFYAWLGSMWCEVDLYKDRFWGDGLLDEPNW